MAERLTDEELMAAIRAAMERYTGYAPRLGAAIGSVFMGKAFGWEVLYLIHNRSTLKKFEEILGFELRDQMEASTELSRKHYVWNWTKEKMTFWKLIRGQIKKKGRTELDDLPREKAELK